MKSELKPKIPPEPPSFSSAVPIVMSSVPHSVLYLQLLSAISTITNNVHTINIHAPLALINTTL